MILSLHLPFLSPKLSVIYQLVEFILPRERVRPLGIEEWC